MKSKLPLILCGCSLLAVIVLAAGPPSFFRSDMKEKESASPVSDKFVEQQAGKPDRSTEPSLPLLTTPPGPVPAGMVWIPGGTFLMGTEPIQGPANPDRIKQDETPVHRVSVDGFFMDETEVTNAQFAEFVNATGYVTFAEIPPKREDFIGVVPDINLIPEENLVAGALIFNADFDRENFQDNFQGWELQAWKYQPGADWRHPTGPDSNIAGKEDHPVVNVVYRDCIAYCQWAGRRLPTEAEWEFACRGGHTDRKYPWGNELDREGVFQCNYWQGSFPLDRQNLDGFLDTAPVKSFPPNDYGLYDMSGNVWEWVNDYYHVDYYRRSPERNPPGPTDWLDPHEPQIEKRVTRGGSFLCNTNNCTGYRCSARMRSDVTSPSYHTGFRTVLDSNLFTKHK